MLFNSLHFLFFFPIVVGIYFAIPYRFRWVLLLIASYYFYMCWKIEYILLIIISTLIDYFAGLKMGEKQDKKERKKYLILSLLTNLGLLFAFKYFNFFNNSIRESFAYLNITYHIPSLKLLLPVGISFYTFQTLSYSFDVYRGKRKPEKHLGIFALYVAFFPQLVAGPIERSTHLIPQFYENYDFDYTRVTNGLKLMLWGFFKKLVIADRLAVLVNQIYNNPTDYSGLPLIIATYFFAFQIYCDFSGYSDIAIGASQVMGFKLMDNFNRPYFSKSISEFWKRWHLSLSTWFKDYLYIPLGGNQVSKYRLYSNILVVFLVSGLWHGANWTFIFWGALHGIYLVSSIKTISFRNKICKLFYLDKFPHLHKYFKILVTFHLVLFGWIFFRANSINEAYYIVTHLFSNLKFNLSIFNEKTLGLGRFDFIIALLSILFMEVIHFTQRHKRMRQFLSEKPIWFRWSVYYIMTMAILLLGKFNLQKFIYFQF